MSFIQICPVISAKVGKLRFINHYILLITILLFARESEVDFSPFSMSMLDSVYGAMATELLDIPE